MKGWCVMTNEVLVCSTSGLVHDDCWCNRCQEESRIANPKNDCEEEND